MRFVYVILVWTVLVGGLELFLKQRNAYAPITQYVPPAQAAGHYRLEVTTTFSIEPDPFALQIDTEEMPPALLVRLAGKEILRVSDRLEQGATLHVDPLVGLREGNNEFFVRATPPTEQAGRANALRLRLYREDTLLHEQTLWSTPPDSIAAVFDVVVGTAILDKQQQETDHDH